ncbi:DUF2760 domain-containing protein [Thermodesulfatator atlanticus]|uniref:DUF2760 domain-containing protein n=1 Tax=Thermodesulfatator atlanticus TaxID=501497 RepID=UPI0003B69E9A|nr:DUF2760 domain-containing protein [Thermodesulfatator atlanticus]
MKQARIAALLISLVVAAALGGLGYYFKEVLPPWAIGTMVSAPILGGIIITLLIRETSQVETEIKLEPEGPEEKPKTPAPKEPTPAPSEASSEPEKYLAAFLGVLQKEGRFLDFLNENLDAYDDAQIGAAVRAIHRKLKQTVFETVELSPVVNAKEGSEIIIEEDFDRKAIRLIGNIKGEPPYQGILRHPGWCYKKINLPKPKQEKILAPAEVEIS